MLLCIVILFVNVGSIALPGGSSPQRFPAEVPADHKVFNFRKYINEVERNIDKAALQLNGIYNLFMIKPVSISMKTYRMVCEILSRTTDMSDTEQLFVRDLCAGLKS